MPTPPFSKSAQHYFSWALGTHEDKRGVVEFIAGVDVDVLCDVFLADFEVAAAAGFAEEAEGGGGVEGVFFFEPPGGDEALFGGEGGFEGVFAEEGGGHDHILIAGLVNVGMITTGVV